MWLRNQAADFLGGGFFVCHSAAFSSHVATSGGMRVAPRTHCRMEASWRPRASARPRCDHPRAERHSWNLEGLMLRRRLETEGHVIPEALCGVAGGVREDGVPDFCMRGAADAGHLLDGAFDEDAGNFLGVGHLSYPFWVEGAAYAATLHSKT